MLRWCTPSWPGALLSHTVPRQEDDLLLPALGVPDCRPCVSVPRWRGQGIPTLRPRLDIPSLASMFATGYVGGEQCDPALLVFEIFAGTPEDADEV